MLAPCPRDVGGKPPALAATARIVVLRHVLTGGEHYDLMIESPRGGALATWRIMLPPSHWAAARRLEMVRLADHRRAYLRREGRISGGRGWVWRIDAGWAIVRRWVTAEVVVDARLRGFTGALILRQVGCERWIATAREAKPHPRGAANP